MALAEHRQYIGSGPALAAASFSALDFEGVTMRVFPLRANLSRLETFCNNYLNIAPEEMARFYPSTPYVFLMVINYGRMAGEASNLGWVAQNEILFSVPVQGRWHQGGEIVEDFATVSPYIWVDNSWSITTGREVFGWPKMMAWHDAGANEWMRDPSKPSGLLEMKTLLFSKDYAGQEIRPRTLLRVEQATPRFLSQFPPDPSHLAEPLVQQFKTAAHLVNSTPDMIRGLSRLAQAGGAETVRRQLGDFLQSLQGGPGNFYGNTINLKQFRASTPMAACYQALTNSRMVFRRYIKGGMLGSFDLLLGDPTAGFSIQIHRYPTYPIVEAFGLEVERELEFGPEKVAEIKPLFPFWLKVDMRYELGKRLCWRTQETPWRLQDKPEERALRTMHSAQTTTSTPFNTTLGPMIGAMEGPFDFYDATLRVLPLRAKSSALAELLPRIDETIKRVWDNPRLGEDSTWEPYPANPKADRDDHDSWVFLTVTNFGSMAAAVNDIGWWAKSDVSIAFLTRVALSPETGAASGEEDLYFLYWPFVFVDSPLSVTEGREVTGLPSAFAKITPGEDPWLTARTTCADRRVLEVVTRDYPALGVGQQGENRLLLEILRSAGSSREKNLVTTFRKTDSYKAFKRGFRYSNLSFKQFRDEEDPNLVCYRSLQAWTRAMGRWVEHAGAREGVDLEPLGGDHEVQFHPSPSFDLVGALGLEVDRWEARPGTSVIATSKVWSPFWLKMDMRAALPTVLAEQSVDGVWRSGPKAEDFLAWMLGEMPEADDDFFPTCGLTEENGRSDFKPGKSGKIPPEVDTEPMKTLGSLVRDLVSMGQDSDGQ
ncbi:MAG: acetoacetate decarboxylase family protein [Thermoanaerobaculia bacterium]